MSEPGLHYEVPTLAQNALQPTVFMDSTGLTAVTALESAVGLILDTKYGALRGPELRSTGAVALLGSATVATYNTGTGAGSVTRVDASNQSYITVGGLGSNGWAELTITNTAATSLLIRSASVAGTTLYTLTTGATATNLKVQASTDGTLYFTASSAATVSFTLTSIRSLPGNHASQSSAGARPTYTARVNRVLTVFSSWTKTNAGTGVAPTVTDNYGSIAAPDGTFTAARVQFDRGAGTTVSDISYIANGSESVKGNTGRVWARTTDGSSQTISYRPGRLTGVTETLNGTWRQLSAVDETSGTNSFQILLYGNGGGAQTRDILLWHPDWRPTWMLTNAAFPDYQEVRSSTDYDAIGFPHRIVGNGTSHFMSTTLDMSGTDKVTVVAGVTKNSDSATGILCEFTASLSTNNGAFYLLSASGPGPNYSVASKGSSAASATTGSLFAAPHTGVVGLTSDIAADSLACRVNTSQSATSVSDQGTGNYASSTLYLFSSGGTSFFFNGGFSSLTVRGTSITTSLLTSLESYTKRLAKLVY